VGAAAHSVALYAGRASPFFAIDDRHSRQKTAGSGRCNWLAAAGGCSGSRTGRRRRRRRRKRACRACRAAGKCTGNEDIKNRRRDGASNGAQKGIEGNGRNAGRGPRTGRQGGEESRAGGEEASGSGERRVGSDGEPSAKGAGRKRGTWFLRDRQNTAFGGCCGGVVRTSDTGDIVLKRVAGGAGVIG
jgi:hypothetical protein